MAHIGISQIEITHSGREATGKRV